MARVLILYLMSNSGHHSAARALEAAFRELDPRGSVQTLDLLRHMHPAWSAVIQKTYLGVVRRTPDLWDALYDNERLDRLTRRVRPLLTRGRHPRFLGLMRGFQPDLVLCTQAYPLNVVQDYVAESGRPGPAVWGVLTDFLPHRFWVVPGNARYVVPVEDAARRLAELGVARERIRVHGIPIHPGYAAWSERPRAAHRNPRVLVMGGGRGLGMRYRTLKQIDRGQTEFRIEAVTGTNRLLRNLLRLRRSAFRHPLHIRAYCRRMPSLYYQADLLVSKPGGATCAESLAMGLPLLIARCLPGQEAGNMQVLVRHGAALHMSREEDLGAAADMLLTNPTLLEMMRTRALALARPDAARRIAREALGS